jgi:hypothetical protein
MPAHVSQLKFEFEVGNGAQAAHDDGEPVLARKIHGETDIALHLDIVHIGEHTPGHVDSLFQREHRRLVGIGGDGHHQPIEDAGRPAHQVGVAVGDRIEGTRVDGCSFEVHHRSYAWPTLAWTCTR